MGYSSIQMARETAAYNFQSFQSPHSNPSNQIMKVDEGKIHENIQFL